MNSYDKPGGTVIKGAGDAPAVLGGVSLCAICAICAVCAAILSGCAESIRQYTKFGGWARPTDKPIVLSGRPKEDSAAFAGSSGALTEADWKVLTKYAPKPVWERIAALQRDAKRDWLLRKIKAGPATTQPASRPAPAIPRNVPTVVLPGGKIQMFYHLRHYGGTKVTTTRDGGTDRRKVVLTGADLQPVVNLLTAHLGDKGTVLPLATENKLVITCDAAVKDSVLKLLAEVDVPGRQVEITVRIFEVNHDFDFQLGAKAVLTHLASDNKQGLAGQFSAKDFVGSVTNPLVGKVADPGSAMRVMQIFGNSGVTLDVAFQALANTGLISVVATPRMTVAAGQTAYMLAGQELPIQSAKFINQNFVSEKVTYRPTGVQLYITPQIVAADGVKLHVVTMVSAVAGFGPTPAIYDDQAPTSILNPIFDSREAETYVTVGDRQTLVLGGLRMVRTITRESKVPFLGDVAGMEWFFKNHRSKKVVNDLYFFVTPRLVK